MTERETVDLEGALADELEVCRAPLRDFAPAPDDGHGLARSDVPAARVRVDPLVLPVPGSVQLVMGLLVHAHNLGRAEKLAFEYPFNFRGRRCAIALQKFGMRLYIADADTAEDSGALDELAREICSKISAAARRLERNVLSTLAQEQTAAGRVTVRNQGARFRGMYEYFRHLAAEAYAGNGMLAREHDHTAGTIVIQHFRFMAEEREGHFNTIAMTTAYFSLLEHLLVLALPATDFDPVNESLTELILSKWQEKLERVFGADDLAANKMRQRLREAAERWRNPYGHGGFDKSHGTLSFHVPGAGAIPVVMSEYRNHPTFRFVPARGTGYDELTQLFDEVDQWLRSSSLWAGMLWAEAGLDVPFNPEFLADFRKAAAAGRTAFEGFLEGESYAVDQAANMDW